MDISRIVQREMHVVTVAGVGPKGDKGDPGVSGGGSGDHTFSVYNTENLLLPAGTPVRYVSLGSVTRASSAQIDPCYGLVITTLPAVGYGLIQDTGVLTLTTDEWDGVTNTSGGLVPNEYYFLSNVTGRITHTPDMSSAALIQVGYSINPTSLRLDFGSPIIL